MDAPLKLDDSLTLWSPDARDGMPLLVLLHGYGADENDLFGLAPYLPDGIAMASVAAPLAPQWPMPGRSWYAIDSLEDTRDATGITAAAEALLRWLPTASESAPSVAL